jgi:hypothetical protein
MRIEHLEEYQELVERFGGAAVITAAIYDLTRCLGEVDSSCRAINATFTGFSRYWEKMNLRDLLEALEND